MGCDLNGWKVSCEKEPVAATKRLWKRRRATGKASINETQLLRTTSSKLRESWQRVRLLTSQSLRLLGSHNQNAPRCKRRILLLSCCFDVGMSRFVVNDAMQMGTDLEATMCMCVCERDSERALMCVGIGDVRGRLRVHHSTTARCS